MLQRSMLKNRLSTRDWFAQYQFLLKPTIILAVIYLVGISALLRANFYYIDDIARANSGYTEWEQYSRYIMVLSAYFLHADTYLTDISPLPQLLAAVFTALAGTIAIYSITEKKHFSVWYLIAAVPMGLSPYFLECFSYKYDSAVMGLSVLFAVLPLLFASDSEGKYIFISALCTILMCMSYQASAGIYPVLVVLICYRRWLDKEPFGKTCRFALISAGSYLAGMMIFRIFFMATLNTHASSDLPPMDAFLPSVIGAYKTFLKHYLTDFKLEWHLFVVILGLCFLYASCRASKRNKLASVLLAVPVLILIAMLSLGVYPFLAVPTFYPRSMYGIGCTVAFFTMVTFSRLPRLVPARVACFLLSWCFFSFAFTYGNALNMQSQYTDYRITATIDDLMESGVLEEPEGKTLRITGSIGYAPPIRNMPQDYQVLNRLIPISFQNSDWYWGTYGFMNYYGLPYIPIDHQNNPWTMELPVLVQNKYHTIASDGTFIWIDLSQ